MILDGQAKIFASTSYTAGTKANSVDVSHLEQVLVEVSSGAD